MSVVLRRLALKFGLAHYENVGFLEGGRFIVGPRTYAGLLKMGPEELKNLGVEVIQHPDVPERRFRWGRAR